MAVDGRRARRAAKEKRKGEEMYKYRIIFVGLLAVMFITSGVAQGQLIVNCIGTESGGTGGPLFSPYCYEVNVPTIQQMIAFDVGDHTGAAPGIYAVDALGNPIGWIGAPGQPGSEQDFDEKTPHGLLSGGPTGACPAITLWTGPPITGGPYYFGHFSEEHSHDVGFTVGTLTGAVKENWLAPVGMGFGPVHAPIPEPATMTVLAIGALGVLVRRRRR